MMDKAENVSVAYVFGNDALIYTLITGLLDSDKRVHHPYWKNMQWLSCPSKKISAVNHFSFEA